MMKKHNINNLNLNLTEFLKHNQLSDFPTKWNSGLKTHYCQPSEISPTLMIF